jgi:Ca2+-binding EF-hand superfamily protein
MRRAGERIFVLCIVVTLGAPWVVGCGRRQSSVTTPAVKPIETSVSAVPAVGPSAAKQEVTGESTATPAPGNRAASAENLEPAAAAESDAGITAPAQEAVSAPVFGKERFLLLAPTNPIIIELQLTIDGQPHTAALEKLVEEVLKLADSDGDGRTTWKELCACKRIKYGQFGNLAVENDNGEKQVIDRYDIARDGVVDRSELPRFLTRNAGASRPFSIRGTFDHRDLNRRGAPTWRVIDADGDGAISPDERAHAAARLSGRDNDDDEILLASDLNPRLSVLDPEMMTDRRRRGPDAARLLGPHADWSAIQMSLEQEYGGGRTLRPDSFALTPELFAQLDKNKDGRIRREEFIALNEVPPQVVIAVEFGNREPGVGSQESAEEQSGEEEESAAPMRNRPRLRLVSVAPSLVERSNDVAVQPGRLTLSVGGMMLTFYTNDTVASDDFSARAKQALDMFDQNKDGYLEKSEVPESLQGQLGRFEAVDADEDGKAYPYEIEAFLKQQQAGLRAQIHAKASDREDALFAALDTDHDERLDGRELEGAASRLAALDQNGDGQITSDELPEVLLIGLARGSLEQADVTFAPPPVIARGPSNKAPRWFTAMDANQDGVISRREFLGSAEKFAELDRNGNGLLEVDEAITKH